MRWTPSVKNAVTTSALAVFFMLSVISLLGGTLLRLVKPLPYYPGDMELVELIPKTQDTTGWYNLVQPLARFDALWYKEVMLHHYKGNLRSTAFFPLFPFAVEFLMILTDLSFEQASLILNTILLFVFFVLLYLLAEKDFGKDAAWQSVALYAFFPTGFFLLSPYAETLLLTLTISPFFLVYRKKYFLSSSFAALATATKPFGAFLIIPLFYLFYKSTEVLKIRLLRLGYLLFIPLVFAAVILYQDAQTGVLWSTFKSQNFWGIKYPTPWELLQNIFMVFTNYSYDLPRHLNLVLAVGGVILLVAARRVIRFELWLLSVIFHVIFLTTTTRYEFIPFFSLSRFFLMLFPLFIYFAHIKVRNIYKLVYMGISIVLFSVFFSFYVLGYFVA